MENERIEEMMLFTVNNPELAKEHFPEFFQLMVEASNEADDVRCANLIDSLPSFFPKWKQEAQGAIGDTKNRLISTYIELYDTYLQFATNEDVHPIVSAVAKKVAEELQQHRQYFLNEKQRATAPTVCVPLGQLSLWWKSGNHSYGSNTAGTFNGLWAWVESQGARIANANGNPVKRESLRIKFNETVQGEQCKLTYSEQLNSLYKIPT